jgi:ABC-2 type transport system ATP-binding protein
MLSVNNMLTLNGIHTRYPQAAEFALTDVTFGVERGEILGLLGPNGAGKTTLISHLAGILPLQRGSISVDGESLQQSRKNHPARIAVAPQEYAFFPTLTVRENLQCFGAVGRGAENFKEPIKSRIGRALAFAQLESFSRQRADALSGGLKRRLNLAIASMSDPDYLLLDEPTVGVDPQSRAFLLDAVRQLASDGMGVIYTSHYMEEVEAIAQRVVIIDHGKVLCQGLLNTLLASGQMELRFEQKGLDDIDVKRILQSYGQIQTDGQILLHAHCQPGQALQALEQAGAQIVHAEFGRLNLEHLFMQLTKRSLRDN